MDTVTYPHADVQARLGESFACVRLQIDKTDLAKRFNVVWTPGLLFIDENETVQYRTYGYHPPEEFRQLLTLGLGSTAFARGDYAAAVSAFGRMAEDGAGTSFHPKALYWLGVAHYKAGDKDNLMKTWNRLIDQHPNSLAAKKAGFIRK